MAMEITGYFQLCEKVMKLQ